MISMPETCVRMFNYKFFFLIDTPRACLRFYENQQCNQLILINTSSLFAIIRALLAATTKEI